MSFLSASRSVLLLSDDGVSVYYLRSGTPEYIDQVMWDSEGFEGNLSALIRNRCSSKPVVIINDMVEQHYRKEKIPKVSPMDRANIVKRRIANAFPSYPIRSAIKLKEKAPNIDGQSGGDIYLFSALPVTDNIRKTLAAINKAHAAIVSFCLLPVESMSMVRALNKKITKISGGGAEWTLFAGQHQSGGLRQIVTKNGELALTRMTPISAGAEDADTWCSDVAGELRGTMSYLSRFGFSPQDGLNVIVAAPNGMDELLSSKIDFDCNLKVLTTRELGNFVSLKFGGRGVEQQRYADILHVAWIGKKNNFQMPLKAVQIEAVNKHVKIATAACVAMVLAVGYLGYLTLSSVAKVSSYKTQIEQELQGLVQMRQERDDEAEKKKLTGVDYMLVQSATTVYDALDEQTMRPLPVIDLIGKSIGADLHIKSMEIKPVVEVAKDDETAEPAPVDPAVAEGSVVQPEFKKFDIVLKIVFPPTLDANLGVQKVGEIEGRLKTNLPNHIVKIVKQVADLSYTGNFVGESTSQKDPQGIENKEYEAQIQITGALR